MDSENGFCKKNGSRKAEIGKWSRKADFYESNIASLGIPAWGDAGACDRSAVSRAVPFLRWASRYWKKAAGYLPGVRDEDPSPDRLAVF